MKVSSFQKEVELAPAILYKNNHKAEDFDIDINADKAKVNNNNLVWAEKQYLTPNSSVLKTFFANLVVLPVKNASLFESGGVNYSYTKMFIAIIAKIKLKYCLLGLTVITQLEKQQNNRLYDYSKH